MKVSRINVSSLFIIIGMSLMCGCQEELQNPYDGLHEMTFHAGWATKTVLQSDGSVYWSPGDKICIFMEDGATTGYEFVSTSNSESASTTFKGTLDGSASKYYALYPYDKNAICEGGTITTTIPFEQTAIEGAFPDGALLSVAVTSDDKLFFKNVCSGIKFSVLHENIDRIVVKSQQPLAGSVNIPASDINNIAIANSGAVNTVTVIAPSGGCFKTSTFYYLTLSPGIHENGIEVEYYNGNNIIAVASIPGPVDFTRAIVNRLYEKDIIYATSITLDMESASLKVGETVTLTPTVTPDDVTDKTVTWTSSDESVAIVADGIVTAKKIGTTTITAKAGDQMALCQITVVATEVTSIELDKKSASLRAGETITLTATVKPDDATNKAVTWTTSDESIASVQDGIVTAKKVGSATITAKAGDKEATCAITVVATEVTSVTLDKTSASLHAGESVNLTATVKPDDATDKTVTWTTSDASVATVDNGVVTAKKVGTATITAKAGDKSATCAITVEATPVTSVTLDRTTAQLKAGETVTLTVTVKPDDATDKTVTWATSDATVATVSDGVVTAVKVGSATITAKAGDKSATCAITVVATPITSVTLDRTTASLKAGETVTLTATVKPDDATDKTVTWTTSDASVATVDNGVVTAKKVGTATITAKAGDKSATCAITVEATPVTSVTLDRTTAQLKAGETVTLTATVKPDDATDKTVTWTTSDASVATVNNGVVLAVGGGSATIRAQTGEFSASCIVSVTVPVESVSLDKKYFTIAVGESATLVATVIPDNATDKNIEWSSDDSSIAVVDNWGKVTAIAEGVAGITAAVGGKNATCVVIVEKAIVPVSSISLDRTELNLTKGSYTSLIATVKPDDATDKTVSWSSSKPSVATVDDEGKVYAVGDGVACIFAKAGDVTATCNVTVTIPVERVEISNENLRLQVGSTYQLDFKVYPEGAFFQTIQWYSTDESIATVSYYGYVTALNSGTASIIVKVDGVPASCDLTVAPAVSSVSLNKNSFVLSKGSSEKLIATVYPEDAFDTSVAWSSKNTNVAIVDQNGVVTGVGSGNAIIVAKAGSKSATCTVTVIQPVEYITLDKTTINLYVNESAQINATVGPSDAVNSGVTWTSSDESVVNVSSNGRVYGVSCGNAVIQAKAGDKTAECSVVVSYHPTTSVTLDKTSLTMKKGDTQTLTANVEPNNADKTVVWSSSNDSIVVVDQQGCITAVGGGEANIIARSGDITASCSVTVTVPAEFMAVENGNVIISKGKTLKLTCKILPEDSTDIPYWVSADPSIVKIDQNGIITALNVGSCGIIAKAGDVTATCIVEVKMPGGENEEIDKEIWK